MAASCCGYTLHPQEAGFLSKMKKELMAQNTGEYYKSGQKQKSRQKQNRNILQWQGHLQATSIQHEEPGENLPEI